MVILLLLINKHDFKAALAYLAYYWFKIHLTANLNQSWYKYVSSS